MIYCNNCGHPNPAGANYCARCGEALEKSEGLAHTEHQGQPHGSVLSEDASSRTTITESTKSIPSVGEEGETTELTPDEEAAVRSLPQGSALLIVRRGPGVGARFLLDSAESEAGRLPKCDIFLDDITVSRHHVKFLRGDGEIVVEDMGSLNGTYINRRLIDSRVVLRPGDEVQIGKFRMIFFASVHGLS